MGEVWTNSEGKGHVYGHECEAWLRKHAPRNVVLHSTTRSVGPVEIKTAQ